MVVVFVEIELTRNIPPYEPKPFSAAYIGSLVHDNPLPFILTHIPFPCETLEYLAGHPRAFAHTIPRSITLIP